MPAAPPASSAGQGSDPSPSPSPYPPNVVVNSHPLAVWWARQISQTLYFGIKEQSAVYVVFFFVSLFRVINWEYFFLFMNWHVWFEIMYHLMLLAHVTWLPKVLSDKFGPWIMNFYPRLWIYLIFWFIECFIWGWSYGNLFVDACYAIFMLFKKEDLERWERRALETVEEKLHIKQK